MTHAPNYEPEPFSLDDALTETEEWQEADPEESQDQSRDSSGGQDLADRHALRRVAGLSTELEDISEVEYRQLRLERVVLVGVWTEGSVADAENSMAELALLAETAGSTVLDAFYQRRQSPDPATYEVDVPGGELAVTWTAQRRVVLTGPAVIVAHGEVDPDALSRKTGRDLT